MSIADTQAQAEQLLQRAGILPVVTAHSVDQARRLSAALLRGGLGAIELTLRTPAALDALVALKKELPDIAVGMGTVLDAEQMQRCIELGADFLVTPGTPPALADALAKAPIPVGYRASGAASGLFKGPGTQRGTHCIQRRASQNATVYPSALLRRAL